MTALALASVVALLAVVTAEGGTTLPGDNGLIVFSAGQDVTVRGNGDCHRGGFEPFSDGNCGDIFTIDPADNSVNGPLGSLPEADDDEPVWSPDNSKIAFESNRDCLPEPEDDGTTNGEPEPDCDTEAPDIYVMNADGSNVQRLTDHPCDDQRPTWSPDGSKIAFESERGLPEPPTQQGAGSEGFLGGDCDEEEQTDAAGIDEDERAFRRIWVMDADGGNQKPLTNGGVGDSQFELVDFGADFAPAWSPEGDKIAFTSLREGGLNLDLICIIGGCGGPVPVPLEAEAEGPVSPLLFDVNTYVIPVDSAGDQDGSESAPLGDTNALDLDIQPSWRPDAERIAFSSGFRHCDPFSVLSAEVRAGITPDEAYGILADGGIAALEQELAEIAGADGDGCGGFEIHAMDHDGSDVDRLTNDSETCGSIIFGPGSQGCYDDLHPAWSPDGEKIAFQSRRPGPGDEEPEETPTETGTAGLIIPSGDVDFGLWLMDADDGGNLTQLAGAPGIADANRRSDVKPDWQSLRADLELTKDGPASVGLGDTISYTITVKNNGPSTAKNAKFDDPLPPGTTFESASGSGASCSGGANITCEFGNLNSGASVTVTLVLRTTAAGLVENTATASSSTFDPTSGNNSDTARTVVVAPGGITVVPQGTTPPAQGVLGEAVDSRAPAVVARGIRRACAARPFTARFSIREASKGTVRSAVYLDGNRILFTRRRSFRVTVPALDLRPGSHRLVVRSTDPSGNRTSRLIRFRVCASQAPAPEFTG